MFFHRLGYSRIQLQLINPLGHTIISCSSKRIFYENYQFSQAITCVWKLQDQIQNSLSVFGEERACEHDEPSQYNYYFLRNCPSMPCKIIFFFKLISLSLCLSVCLYWCLSVSQSVCLSVCLLFSIFFHLLLFMYSTSLEDH